MNTKHTPGPWSIDTDGEKLFVQSDAYAVAMLQGNDVSNARLIAAAPDLLEALQELLADKYLADPINADRMASARAAIAKAVQ